MNSVPNVADILTTLEQNTPTVYVKCLADLVDKKGQTHRKKCIINLTTGDVFKNRALRWAEQSNYSLFRRYSVPKDNIDDISLYAYQCAQDIDENIVLTTWVFADYYNYPATTKIDMSWCGASVIPQHRLGEKVDENALFNVKLSTPRIASVVVITQNKDILSWDNVEEYGLMKPQYCNPDNQYLSVNLIHSLTHATESRKVVNLLESFKKVFRIGYIGANKYIAFDSYRDIPVFMKAPVLEKKLSAGQTKIDQLTSIKLHDHSIVAASENTICYADRVNDEWVVLRWYRKLMPAYYAETSRMYVNKTEAIHCRSDLKGNWVHAGAKIKAETFNADKICLQSDSVFDGTKLEYFKNVSEQISNRSAALYMLTMYPEFEKLCKSGLEWLCELYVAEPYQMSWKKSLESMVGHVDWKAKNILKMIGVNRHQIEKFAEYRKKNVA